MSMWDRDCDAGEGVASGVVQSIIERELNRVREKEAIEEEKNERRSC